ncbi:MAG: hypothetical protein FIB00_13555 [Chloroflexi bacterium]|jgi:hypothetical protein|nr:hypothetical protein [Dehalococcoidia bacterium]MCZ7576771.1 hypothetical protein [Dehalococcoidia bacterium]NJD66238.1 hypothetical protein [Chloroflexota bacterium]PWB44412.1 MAG: hypothetical protein C3F10_08930 [Dehalococcoidia bacterium]
MSKPKPNDPHPGVVTEYSYPADPAEAALRLFLGWFGPHYARSVAVSSANSDGATLTADVSVGRKWSLAVTVLNTLAADANLEWEAARAAVEQRLDTEGRPVALWAPRGARLPASEPGLSELVLALSEANTIDGGRLEVRRPVKLYFRRADTTGSVVTAVGGLAAHWAQFTNRVPGSFQLNSAELLRLPASKEERDELAERIVLAAQQPDIDETHVIPAEDVWTANELGAGQACVLGTPAPENDEWSSSLRRNLRRLLKEAVPGLSRPADSRALVVLGAATYADEEKLSWALRGMDPTLYGGYDILAVIADGLLKPILQPYRQTLPWDAPLG